MYAEPNYRTPTLTTIAQGVQIKTRGTFAGYAWFILPDGRKGWIKEDWLTKMQN